MAAMYAADHANEIDGLAMLAAYSTKKLPNKMKVVSIVGTNDKILKWESYNKNLINLPENYTEVKIENGKSWSIWGTMVNKRVMVHQLFQ